MTENTVRDLEAEIIRYQALIIENQTKIINFYASERDEWLPVSTVAKKVGLPVRTVRGMLENGHLETRKSAGSHTQVNVREVEARIRQSVRLQHIQEQQASN